ncbi:hypothetical protein V5R04_11985 [Jonesiaceae bacterium BS-20]|uniref:DUF1700 domain-containing protein n=1 Tax=Jonesiaceae bacterium BS-20 TaxID=3120821 RepID=A0AAU7DRV1_9MICO
MTRQLSVRDAMVREYLTDLEVALAGADPVERAETLASIREHLELSVPASATIDQTQRVLRALGTPGQIALAATQGPVVTMSSIPQSQVAMPKDTSDPDIWSYLVLYGAVASVLLSIVPFLMMPIALACLVGAIWDLRRRTGPRLTAWVALVLANIGLFGNPALGSLAQSIFLAHS